VPPAAAKESRAARRYSAADASIDDSAAAAAAAQASAAADTAAAAAAAAEESERATAARAAAAAESAARDLAAVSAAGTAAGMATPGFQNTLDSTAVNGAGSGNYYITIEAGLGDTTEIAQAVTSVLQTYGEKIGGVPVKVKTPKAAPAKKPKQKKK
jgi:hypothetical protein